MPTKTNRTARNVIFLLRGVPGSEQIVRTFRANETLNGQEYKSPKRALTAFLQGVAEDTEHELHGALLAGELSQAASHPSRVRLTSRPSITV